MHPDRSPIHDVNPALALRADATICFDCDRFGHELPLETWATFPPDLNVLSDSDFFPIPGCDGGAGAACGMTPHVPRDRVPAPLVAFWRFLCELASDAKGFAALTMVGGILIGAGMVAAVIGGMVR